MTERTALRLISLGSTLLLIVAFLGLGAVHAGQEAMVLAVIVPLALSSYGISRVTMHYGSSRRRQR